MVTVAMPVVPTLPESLDCQNKFGTTKVGSSSTRIKPYLYQFSEYLAD